MRIDNRAYINAHRFLITLKDNKYRLTEPEFSMLRWLALDGKLDAAERELKKIIGRKENAEHKAAEAR